MTHLPIFVFHKSESSDSHNQFENECLNLNANFNFIVLKADGLVYMGSDTSLGLGHGETKNPKTSEMDSTQTNVGQAGPPNSVVKLMNGSKLILVPVDWTYIIY